MRPSAKVRTAPFPVSYTHLLDEVVLDKLNLTADKEPDMAAWSAFVEKVKHPSKKIEIALVGKYTELPDAYKSICESFIHAGAVNDCKVKLRYVNSEKITRESAAAQMCIRDSGATGRRRCPTR